jgi:hypothetical protein
MYGRLAWYGRCSCCNFPDRRGKQRAREKRFWRSETRADFYRRLSDYCPEGYGQCPCRLA